MSKIDLITAREEYLARREVTKCPPGTAYGGHSPQRRVTRSSYATALATDDPVPPYHLNAQA